MKKLTTKEFIQKAKQVHLDKYDYSKVLYEKSSEKVEIICPEHGSFYQTPNNHLKGKRCNICFKNYKNELQTKDLSYFINKSNIIHNYIYDYSLANYKSARSKVKIICKKHGVFEQSPDSHFSGRGCPKCVHKVSKPEIEVQDFIKSLGFKIKTNDRKIINPYELDIYIPELKKAIEFNGTYYHYSEKYFTPGKHSTKSKLCKSLNINLLHLREDLWNRNKEKMKKVIHKFLNFKN